jgi:5-methylcytosine-specific restriction endonuclease McrA
MVLVVDKHKHPLSPTTPKRAHQLLESRRARLHKRFPYTIRMVDVLVENAVVAPLVLGIDPGAKATGMALVRLGTPTASPGLSPENPLSPDQPPEGSPDLSPENPLSPDQPPEGSPALSPEKPLSPDQPPEASPDRSPQDALSPDQPPEDSPGLSPENPLSPVQPPEGSPVLSPENPLSPGQPPEDSPDLSPENPLSPDQPPEASPGLSPEKPLSSDQPPEASPDGALPGADPEMERLISILPARMPSWDTPQFVLGYFELVHRGDKIHLSMLMRSMYRRRRRSQNLWYREPRFNNRKRPEGWLAPSVRHRVEGVEALVKKLMRLAPITSIVIEDSKFDTQAVMNPEISGVEYQQGDLYRREAMEYLLEKWGRKCVYCGAEKKPLQMDHVVPKSKGGSDRVSNLVPACEDCNQKKGNKDLEVYLEGRPELLKTIKSGLKEPLRGAAVMNGLRHVIKERLEKLGVPVISSRASITKLNRGRFGVPKFHAGDAACVGPKSSLEGWNRKILVVTSMGRGKKQRETHNEFGFPYDNSGKPRRILPRAKRLFGYATGDIVIGTPTKGKHKGQSLAGRVVVRSSGCFDIKFPVEKKAAGKAKGGKKAKSASKAKGGEKAKKAGKAKEAAEVVKWETISVSHKNAKLLQKGDGYAYHFKKPHRTPAAASAVGASDFATLEIDAKTAIIHILKVMLKLVIDMGKRRSIGIFY